MNTVFAFWPFVRASDRVGERTGYRPRLPKTCGCYGGPIEHQKNCRGEPPDDIFDSLRQTSSAETC